MRTASLLLLGLMVITLGARHNSGSNSAVDLGGSAVQTLGSNAQAVQTTPQDLHGETPSCYPLVRNSTIAPFAFNECPASCPTAGSVDDQGCLGCPSGTQLNEVFTGGNERRRRKEFRDKEAAGTAGCLAAGKESVELCGECKPPRDAGEQKDACAAYCTEPWKPETYMFCVVNCIKSGTGKRSGIAYYFQCITSKTVMCPPGQSQMCVTTKQLIPYRICKFNFGARQRGEFHGEDGAMSLCLKVDKDLKYERALNETNKLESKMARNLGSKGGNYTHYSSQYPFCGEVAVVA